MKNKKPNAEHIWKQFEDHLVPRLRLSVIDRAVYSHLLRHSRLEGKLRLRFSILGLARHIRLSGGPAREAVRRLVAHGVLRLVERSKAGHVVEVRLPDEIRAGFYCLRRITPTVQCLDHVVPRAKSGRNSYRNLVSSCMECNSQKGEKAAEDFLRRLYRERRLTPMELNGRLRALDALASGKLPPALPAATNALPRKSRSALHPTNP